MSRKTTAVATSKISPQPTSSNSSSQQKSSILKSSFAPSRLQLRLFASVIQSFESQHLRIHDTNTSRLRCVHHAKPNAKINCLDWGQFPKSKAKSAKSSEKPQSRADDDAVVAYGTSDSEIYIFSPAQGKLLSTLTGAQERGIYDFKFSQHSNGEAWSIGGDATLVQWDLTSERPVKTISLPEAAIRTLSQPSPIAPQLICASSAPYALTLDPSNIPQFEPFDSMKRPIHTLFRSGADGSSSVEFLLSSDEDRYISIYDMTQKRLVRSLIAAAGVHSADLLSTMSNGSDTWDTQMLAIVTIDGQVEFFSRPFAPPAERNGDIKQTRKGLTQKSNAQVRLVRSGGQGGRAHVLAASLQGPDLWVASVDGGVDVSFQKVRWQDEGNGELLFDGPKDVVRVRTGSSLAAATANGVKDLTKSHLDEARTVVVNGVGENLDHDASQGMTIDISSSGEDEDDEEEEQDDGSEGSVEGSASDEEMEDVGENISADGSPADADEDAEEPSFGDMLASKTSQAIDIADAFAPESTALAKVESGRLALPTGMSLGTVLTQSLRTNDRSLLEACLHTTDLDVVRNTIQRLDSSLAGTLLSKLAERISSRPGRYGDLQIWVQQICVAHGAAISAQPAVLKQVKSLYNVLGERSRCLSPLLLLKGKLDMLNAQVTFRRQLAAQRALKADNDGAPGMIYIEGQEDNWSSEDDHDEVVGQSGKPSKRNNRKTLDTFDDEEGSEDEDMPLANGVSDSDEEADSDDENPQLRAGTLVDDEAADEVEDSDAEEEEGADLDDDMESSDGESLEDEEDEEEDSELDSFIKDGSVDFDAEADDLDGVDGVDEVETETPPKPAAKRSRLR